MQNTKEFFIATFKSETPKFVNVVNALPADKISWKPDEKSKTAIELASMMAIELGQVAVMLKAGAFTYESAPKDTLATPADAAAAIQTAASEIQSHVESMSDADWEKNDGAMMV